MADAAAISDPDRLLAAAADRQRRGDDAGATPLLHAALERAPEHPGALNSLGMAALRRRDFGEARALFTRAAASDPRAPPLWINLATANRALGDDEGERASLAAALAVDRLNFMAYLRLAELHERRGEGREAMENWAAVVQMAGSAPERPPVMADALARGQRFVADHNRALQDQLDAALGERLRAAGPGARRFNACLDHSLRGRTIYRNECAGVHFPFLPADEYFDRAHFPWLPDLERHTPAIRREAERLLAGGGNREDGAIRPYVRQDAGTPSNKWSSLDGSLDWSACFLWEYGARNDPVCDLCPATAAALAAVPQSRIPGKAPSAFFSVLKPGAHIPPHTGVTNTRAIVHLPLVVPPGCAFRVGGETREWREGEAFAFDDTIEHEAWNRGTAPRIVLIFDVWNPHLTADEQALLTDFFQVVEQPRDI